MPEKLSDLIPRPSALSINTGLSFCRQSTLLKALGKPGKLTRDCSPVTGAKVKALLVTENVGPFRVTGIRPAVDTLKRIFIAVKEMEPEVYEQVKTAGMTCCRAIRGSTTTFSNHSWGSAIDLYFGAFVDEMGDGRVQVGLLKLYQYFHREGWFWGAEFSREDGMHWELADETVRKWAAEGKFKP